MKNPTIKHKVCSYDGRLWVVDTVRTLGASVVMMLRDGDEHCSAEMSATEYLKLNSSLEEQEFVILPSVVVPPVKPPPPPVKRWKRVAGSGGLVGQDVCANCGLNRVSHSGAMAACPI